MNDIYTGELVRLSMTDEDNFAKAAALWNRHSEFVRLLNTGVTRVISQKKEKEWIEKMQKEESGNEYFFDIHALAEDRLLGFVDLFIESWAARDTFVGIGIGERDFWGKGYGTDAMRLILRYAFAELNLNRVSLGVFEYNPRAVRSYEKAGFQHEGRMRGVLYKEGKRWDMLFMGIQREEWMEQNGIKTTN